MENQRSMEEVLKLQREHFLNEGPPSYELRIDRLDRVQDMVIQNKERITEALIKFLIGSSNLLLSVSL